MYQELFDITLDMASIRSYFSYFFILNACDDPSLELSTAI